jgi:hypothetical protein
MGRVNGALSFSGTNQYVTCGNVPVSANMSLAAWLNPDDVASTRSIIAKASSYALKVTGSDLTYTRPGVADYGVGGVGLMAGVWQHVVVTINGGRTK